MAIDVKLHLEERKSTSGRPNFGVASRAIRPCRNRRRGSFSCFLFCQRVALTSIWMTESRLHIAPTPESARRDRQAGGGIVRRTFWALAIGGLIFFASSRSYVASPGITRVDDKLGHFAVYGLLGTLVCRMGRGWRAALRSLILVSAFGASDEWHQSFVPGRVADAQDWIADTVGTAIAVACYTGWPWYRELLERPVRWRKRRVEN
jgi:VanZ family protein